MLTYAHACSGLSLSGICSVYAVYVVYTSALKDLAALPEMSSSSALRNASATSLVQLRFEDGEKDE
jgi:hypothetical protein